MRCVQSAGRRSTGSLPAESGKAAAARKRGAAAPLLGFEACRLPDAMLARFKRPRRGSG